MLLASLIFILQYDFNNTVALLGSIRISQGNNLLVFNILEFGSGIGLFAFVHQMGRRVKKNLEIQRSRNFQSSNVKEVMKFIIDQDWDSLLTEIRKGKNGFTFYTCIEIFVFAFMFYLILSIAFSISVGLLLSFHAYQIALIILSVILALVVRYRKIVNSVKEIRDMRQAVDQLRWFAERIREEQL